MNEIPHEILQGGGYIGPTFTAVFFWRNIFWRVVIPIIYGRVAVNLLNAMPIMPVDWKRELIEDPRASQEYKALWTCAYRYDRAMHEVQHIQLPEFLKNLLYSADRDLRSTVSDLCQREPNSNAMHSARLGTEKVLKAF